MSDPVTITVNTPPTATITPPGNTMIPNGGSITLEANNGVGYTYQWYLDGNPIFGASSVTYDATSAGDYTVAVNNGCVTMSSTQTLTAESTSISHLSEDQMKIYPNPFNSTTVLNANDTYNYSISDLTGKIVKSGNVFKGDNLFDLSRLNRGMYILRLQKDGKVSFIERIVKK